MRPGLSKLVGPPMAVRKGIDNGVDPASTIEVRRGDEVSVGEFEVRAVAARHAFEPEPTPDAVGFVVQTDTVRLYHSGDTEYDNRILADTVGVTASVMSINGTTSNMSAYEAALLSWRQGVTFAAPMHYGLWRDADYGEGATLDPQLFVDTYKRLAGTLAGDAFVFSIGARCFISADGLVSTCPLLSGEQLSGSTSVTH